MILVDTSVWIDHLRARDDRLVRELNSGTVLSHSFVIGEVALGQMRRRREILADLQGLKRLPTASDSEVLWQIEARSLAGTGIGYVDAHLLAAVGASSGTTLWTRDRRLRAAAGRVGVLAPLT